MSYEFQTRQHVDTDVLFSLAAGELPQVDARVANAHLAMCRGCRRLYTGARELQRESLRMGDTAATGVDDVTHARLWQSLAPEAAAAAERVQRRQAWSLVLTSPRLRWAAAIVVVVGAGLAVWGLGRDSSSSRETAIAGASAVQQCARGPAADPALGPATDSKMAKFLRPVVTPLDKRRGRLQRRRPHRLRRVESAVAMDLDLTGPVAPPRQPGSLSPAPGERKLRCGGLLAAGGATVQILRDRPQSALIKLRVGQVGLRVPKLPQGGRVVIVTPDARVRVVGTRFTVKRGQKPQTTVTVTQGVVWVTPTGRNRKTVVLKAGDSDTVLGEVAYLQQVRTQLTAALSAGRLKDAARLGRRYLDVISKPARAATMKLRLAGILARLGRTAEAVKLYQNVMGSAPHAVARQNALAFLARLYERIGKTGKALKIWRGLVKKYPGGLFTVDALMALVRAECNRAGAAAVRNRKQLAKRAGKHRAAQALLQRCSTVGGRP